MFDSRVFVGYARSCEARSRAYKGKVFDWDTAAQLIKDSGYKDASAGLSGDWDYTGGSIFTNGKPDTESYTYLSSLWATPELVLDGEVIDCYLECEDEPDWDSSTKWPQSALDILGLEGDK